MANKKIISFRADTSLLEKLDSFIENRPYLNRSYMINACLSLCLDNMPFETLFHAVSNYQSNKL